MTARKRTSSRLSSKKKTATRCLAWSDEETECLLSLWHEHNVEQQLEDRKENKGSIYKILFTEMENQGHEKSCQQFEVRMHTLTRSFWECKKKLKTSGEGRKLCKFYTQLNGTASSPVKLVESMGRRRRFPKPSHENDTDDDSDDMSQGISVDNTQKDNGSITDDDGTDDNRPEPNVVDEGDEDNDENHESNDTLAEQKLVEKKEKKGCDNKEVEKSNKITEKKRSKSRLETALGTVMAGFTENNSKFETAMLLLENEKVDADLKKIEVEK